MTNGKLGIGLVGLGMIAKTHYLALQNHENCYLQGCWSHTPAAASAWAEEHRCKAYGSFEEMLSDPQIDAVAVITPPGAHLDYALAAIRAKKHVLVEKPMEIKTDRVEQMIEEAHRNHVVLSCLFQSRYFEAAEYLKKAVDDGRFGTISLCDAQIKWFRSQAYYDSAAWRGTKAIDGGGIMMQQSIHAIDLLLYIMGSDPLEIAAFTSTVSHDIEVEDTAVAALKFPNGALGIIEGTTSAWPGSLKRIEICGTDGQAVIEEDSITMWRFRDERPQDEEIRRRFSSSTSSGGSADPSAINFTGHARQYADFASAVINKKSPLITGEEGLRSVRLIEALYKSADEGRYIQINQSIR